MTKICNHILDCSFIFHKFEKDVG